MGTFRGPAPQRLTPREYVKKTDWTTIGADLHNRCGGA